MRNSANDNVSNNFVKNNQYLTDSYGYAKYRVNMMGNLHESSLHTMSLTTAIPLLNLQPDQLSKRLLRRKRTARMPGVGGSNISYLPQLPEMVPHACFCGLVIDDDFRGVVEDGNGEVVYDFTKKVFETAGAAHCNDNDRFEIHESDFIDLYDDDEDDICEVGLLKLDRVTPGVIEHMFVIPNGFDPKLLDIELVGIDKRKLTNEVLYNGSYADDVDGFRYCEVLPTAKIRIAKL